MLKLRNFNTLSILPVLLISIFSIAINEANAAGASLYLSPSTGTYSVGRIFSVSIELDSREQIINAAEATLKFDPDKLDVMSISKAGSIFSLWTTEPTFSNSGGTLSFGGGTPDNFNGASGIIATVSFQAKTAGACKVDFLSGSVLAADYKGTNVLASMIPGAYVIQPAKFPLPEYTPPEGAPEAPNVSSPTHPASEKWYSNNDPKFIWTIPSDMTGVKLLVDNNPFSLPTIFYSGVISERQLEDLDDGIWYFHVQLRNESGWGGVSHFKFQIDTQPPTPFEIKVQEGEETIRPRPTLFFETIDEPSGIAYFEVRVNKENPVRVEKPEYKIPPQSVGKHLVLVEAIDKAGNRTISMVTVSIIPPAFIRIGGILIDYLTITITLFGLVVIIIFGTLWFWRKIKKERKRLRKETTEAEKALYRAFRILSKEVTEQIAQIDGKPQLSQKERRMSENLKKALGISKKIISKEIKDIEEELK